RYEGWDLIDAKPEYKDGRVWVTIPSLAVSGGSATQMILIRRKKAPADPRDEQMRQRVLKDMTSKDPRVLSAALWIAGFRPQWKLGKKLVPFISHRDWRVRRSTAESLGRLKYLPAQVALIAAIQKENDGHVLGDQLIALRKMGSEKTFDQCLAVLKRDSLKVQGQQIALQVLNALTKDSPDLDQKKAIAIAMQFETHPDKRLAHAAKALKKSLKK
ncbi:MAG: HEAT repeat domain-containing protein, partial [Lentisphaeria bacterium]|nr:HEAT repeat domain-containing protein [Lentisphaeria bacterium]NQZ71367.1 HEAT repeat domain-containing protein [Lentisphaeria bacterium]